MVTQGNRPGRNLSSWPAHLFAEVAGKVLRTQASRNLSWKRKSRYSCARGLGQFLSSSSLPNTSLWGELDSRKVLLSLLWGQLH